MHVACCPAGPAPAADQHQVNDGRGAHEGPSFATSFLDLQVCQHDVACLQALSIRMPQLLQRTAKVLRDEDARGEPAARRARLSPYGRSSHLASAFGTLTGPAVWLRLEGVVACRSRSSLLRLASDVLWDQRGAEPREAKMAQT